MKVGGALEGRLGLLVGDELPELGLLLVADRLLERDRGLGGPLDLVDLIGVDPRDLGDLVRGGLAAQLGDQLALGATEILLSSRPRGPGCGSFVPCQRGRGRSLGGSTRSRRWRT